MVGTAWAREVDALPSRRRYLGLAIPDQIPLASVRAGCSLFIKFHRSLKDATKVSRFTVADLVRGLVDDRMEAVIVAREPRQVQTVGECRDHDVLTDDESNDEVEVQRLLLVRADADVDRRRNLRYKTVWYRQ